MKPCLSCGEPSPESYCTEHTPRRYDSRRGSRVTDRGPWKRLSKRIRKSHPCCEWCGSAKALTVDHIIPYEERPDLELDVTNLRVLCRPCHENRGDCTDAERAAVRARMAARSDGQTWGVIPVPHGVPGRHKPQGPLHTTRRSSSRALHAQAERFGLLLVGVNWLFNALPSVRRVCESAISHADCQRPVVFDCDGGGFGVGLDGAIREFDCGFHARSIA